MLLSTLRKLVFDPRFAPARRSRRAPPRQRPPTCKPCLELLEDRLPPGDVVLGAVLGSALWGPSLSATDSELWTPEGTSAGSLAAALRGPGQSRGAATTSGSLAAESVLTTADHPAEQPRRQGGEAGSVTAPLLAGGKGDGLPGSAAALFDVDHLFASALTDPLQGSGAPRRGGAATSAEPVVGPAQGGGEATGGGAAASPNVVVGASAGAPGVAQSGAPTSGASSSLAALSSYAGLPGALPQPAANTAGLAGALPQPGANTEELAGATPAAAADQHGSAVHATFDLSAPAGAAFPSNRFTVADASNPTGLRVNLPWPDSITHPSDYADTQVLNTLDGFNLQPRLSIPFDGPIDVNVNSVNSSTVFLIRLGDVVDPQDRGGQVVGINQAVWDPATNTLHAESDQFLDQHTRYALIVTNGVHDTDGQPVQASEDFERFRHDLNFGQTDGDPDLKAYRKDLLDASAAAAQVGVPEREIVTASVFTTQSATAVLEKIRDQIHDAATPAPADFNLGSDGSRTVFSRDEVTGITFHEQTKVDPLQPLTDVQLTADLAALPLHGAVSELAFGKYLSPDYEVHPGEYIPAVGTRTGTPVVKQYNEIDFNLFLPSGKMPKLGWPVAIYGHGNTDIKNDSFLVAATLAEQGIATIAINAVGHGYGPDGTLTVNSSTRGLVTFAAGGRGRDQNADQNIDANEGISATSPRSVLFYSDGIRQTAADLMQLVRVIEGGVDVEGDGGTDLDSSRIYYVGHSLGANYGTVFLAVEPSVRAGVLNAPGNPPANRQLAGRAAVGLLLQSRQPSLLNPPGVKVFGGLTVNTPYFDENKPLRDGIPLQVTLADGTTRIIQSPVTITVPGGMAIQEVLTNTVPGAMAIQEVLENTEWASEAGSPVAYASHLRKAPLTDVPPKLVIYQFNEGDRSAPNPNTTAILRAGELADRATFYRHDLAFAEDPKLPKNPHRFLLGQPASASPLVAVIARSYQEQIATFFASDGRVIDDLSDVTTPDGTPLFEVPIQGPLPEGLNYIP